VVGGQHGPERRRSRLIVDAPASLKLRIRENNLNFARRTEIVRGRQVLTWATGDLPRLTPEPYAADSNGVYMSIGLASPLEWADIGTWYGGLANGRYDLPTDVQTRVRGLVRNARSARDSVAAIQRWVAQDIRYVSVALGIGGYQPRSPAEVVSTGFGDCKDKATLFVAAMRYLGFDAAPVLTNANGSSNATCRRWSSSITPSPM
jgi:transglutaminase-like putative cysteine protease